MLTAEFARNSAKMCLANECAECFMQEVLELVGLKSCIRFQKKYPDIYVTIVELWIRLHEIHEEGEMSDD